MAPTKLTEAEKETIFRLYRETDETTSTLSRQYRVSVSTITRLLKSRLPLEEYEDLVRSKRSGLSRNSEDPLLDGLGEPEESVEDEENSPQPAVPASDDAWADEGMNEPQALASSGDRSVGGDRRRRRRSSVSSEAKTTESSLNPQGSSPQPSRLQPSQAQPSQPQQLDLLASPSDTGEDGSQADRSRGIFGEEPPERETPLSFQRPILRKSPEPEVSPESSLDEEEEDEDYVYSFGDEEFGDDEDEFDEDDDGEEQTLGLTPLLGQNIEILSLSEAHLPRVCYLVVDRTGELVTCHLQDFRELGQIPETEAHHRTLPLFDNHRIARRFSRRTQRVIKLPDGKMLQKTARWLEAKGITRLLLDGKVYDLER
jgi:hypothetical protein